jgi:hypothetical protein
MDIKAPIKYHKLSKKYKYTLDKTCCIKVDIPGHIKHRYFTLHKGLLWIKKGYQWDGATMCPDFKTIIKPSLLHDCMYQMIKLGLIDKKQKFLSDVYFKNFCIKEGMFRPVALIVFCAVYVFGGIVLRKKGLAR